jgi:hypothetical protein
MATRKRPVSTKHGHGIPTFARLVRESLEAGMTRREAEAHARKIRASYDLIEVNPRTGGWRYVTDGASIFDLAKSPTAKRPKGKTRRLKGAE